MFELRGKQIRVGRAMFPPPQIINSGPETNFTRTSAARVRVKIFQIMKMILMDVIIFLLILIFFQAITEGDTADFAAIGAPGVVIPRLALELK